MKFKKNINEFKTVKILKNDAERVLKLQKKHGGKIYEWFNKILNSFEKIKNDKK